MSTQTILCIETVFVSVVLFRISCIWYVSFFMTSYYWRFCRFICPVSFFFFFSFLNYLRHLSHIFLFHFYYASWIGCLCWVCRKVWHRHLKFSYLCWYWGLKKSHSLGEVKGSMNGFSITMLTLYVGVFTYNWVLMGFSICHNVTVLVVFPIFSVSDMCNYSIPNYL